MKVCKLEYMIKNIDLISRKELIALIDKDSLFHFHRVHIDDLEEFKQRKPVYCEENEAWSYKCAKRRDKELRLKYKGIFERINDICINNHTYPIFKDPSNIEECLKLRENLLRIYDEETLNDFFHVNTFYEYEPPKYIKIVSYPAIFNEDEETGGWDVTVPDIFGGVTCGDSYLNAIEMAKDMIKLMIKEAPGQCFPPKSLEETKNNFPDKIVLMIEVDLN